MRFRATVLTVVVSSLLWSSSAMAQQRPSASSGRPEAVEGRHVVDSSVLRQAIAGQAVTDQQNRAAVLGVLNRSEVRDVAGRLGLTVKRAEGAVSALNSVELARLAGSARMVNAQLAGGDSTVVISVTTLLLIIIIIILVAD